MPWFVRLLFYSFIFAIGISMEACELKTGYAYKHSGLLDMSWVEKVHESQEWADVFTQLPNELTVTLVIGTCLALFLEFQYHFGSED